MNRRGIQKQFLYLRKVKRNLICKSHTKRKFLCQLQNLLLEFERNHPDGTVDDIINEIGTPAQVAQAMMESLEPEEIRWVKTIRRMALIGFGVLITVVVVLFALFSYQRVHAKQEQYYITEKTIIYAEAEAPENESRPVL